MYFGAIVSMMIDTEKIKDGAVTASKANDDFVKTVPQTLTDAKKNAARANIGVDSSLTVTEKIAEAVNTIDEELAAIGDRLDDVEDGVEGIEAKIPAQASSTNQLADKGFVNSSVQTATANFRGAWATKAAVPTDPEDYPEDYAGSTTPTTNDYLVVTADETKGGGTWRYKYVGLWSEDGADGWQAEYQVNETPLTAAQLAALNSNVTAAKVAEIDEAVRFTEQTLTEAQKTQARENIGVTDTALLVEVTHSQLKAMRDAGTLVPGTQYRITDYECTTIQADTQSAGHAFDIIVTADDESTLNENAKAIQHDGDTYFADCNLAAWELKYALDNDRGLYGWADRATAAAIGDSMAQFEERRRYYRSPENDVDGEEYGFAWKGGPSGTDFQFTNTEDVVINVTEMHKDSPTGVEQAVRYYAAAHTATNKGVVYRLKDEAGNECPYDFKNIQFKGNGKAGTLTTKYYYTFSVATGADDSTITDHSLDTYYCYENKINGYWSSNRQQLNFNVFRNTSIASSTKSCHDNTFGSNCFGNTFGAGCNDNTFGDYCFDNTFGAGCNDNTFGDYCHDNTFGDYCHDNTFGDYCHDSTFGNSFYHNTFGDYCHENTFGNGYGNTFGDYCFGNTFGAGCNDNTFGSNCNVNKVGNFTSNVSAGNYVQFNGFGADPTGTAARVGNIERVTLDSGVTYATITGGISSSNLVKNAHLLGGYYGGTVTFTANKDYSQMAGVNSSGAIKVWAPANLV